MLCEVRPEFIVAQLQLLVLILQLAIRLLRSDDIVLKLIDMHFPFAVLITYLALEHLDFRGGAIKLPLQPLLVAYLRLSPDLLLVKLVRQGSDVLTHLLDRFLHTHYQFTMLGHVRFLQSLQCLSGGALFSQDIDFDVSRRDHEVGNVIHTLPLLFPYVLCSWTKRRALSR